MKMNKLAKLGLIFGLTAMMLLGGCGNEKQSQKYKEALNEWYDDDEKDNKKDRDLEKDDDEKVRFKQFIEGSLYLTVWKDYSYYGLPLGEKYSMEQMLQRAREKWNDGYYFEEGETAEVIEQKYAFIDCGMDGHEELLIAMFFKYPSDDYVDLYFVVFWDDEEGLTLRNIQESYYRSETSVNEYGYIASGGSSGASSYGFSYAYINGDGEEISYYSGKGELGLDAPAVLKMDFEYGHFAGYDLPGASWSGDYSDYYECETYYLSPVQNQGVMDSDTYYDQLTASAYHAIYDADGNLIPPGDKYRAYYDSYGVRYASSKEELKKTLEERAKEVGLSMEVINGEEPNWIQ